MSKILGALSLMMAVFGAVAVVAGEQQASAPGEEGEQGGERDWVDSSHDYVADSANRLVQWMDDFYGTQTADVEAASSRIRVRFNYRYDELDEGDFKTRVRGKVQLPRLSKRLALVIEGEDGEGEGIEAGPTTDDDDEQVGLQYTFGEFGRNRLDGLLSVNSSLDLRTGLRFRYDGQYSDKLTGRLVQDLAYQTGDRGWFTRTQLDGYRRVDDDDLIAWINRVEYGDDTDGVEWRSSLQWRHKLTEKSVLSYMTFADGVTDPKTLTENYGFGVNYRTSIFKRYLFFEIEPAYMWRKEADFDDREGVYAITTRFEIYFEKQPPRREAAAENPAQASALPATTASLRRGD